MVGLRHQAAPVEVRERLAFEEGSLHTALDRLKQTPGFIEGMILSTCNRVEVALTCEDATASLAVDEFLADTRQVARDFVRPHLYRFEDGDAIRHLFRVASSLDSMVVGEPQILGQLKSACPVGLSVSKRSFDVAKQFAFKKRRGQTTHVDRHHRLNSAR